MNDANDPDWWQGQQAIEQRDYTQQQGIIMSVRTLSSGGDFTPAPAGMHVARLYRVIDLGTHFEERWDKYKRLGILVFELPRCLMRDGEAKGQPYSVQKRYTLSHAENATLRLDLESWYGRRFATAELDRAGGFALEKLIGRTAMLNVVHSDDGQWANIKSINPLPDGMDCPPPVNPPLVFGFDPFDAAAFSKLSDRMQETIRKSREFQNNKPHFEPAPGMQKRAEPVVYSNYPPQRPTENIAIEPAPNEMPQRKLMDLNAPDSDIPF